MVAYDTNASISLESHALRMASALSALAWACSCCLKDFSDGSLEVVEKFSSYTETDLELAASFPELDESIVLVNVLVCVFPQEVD